MEPCLTYFVRRDREQKKLVLRLGPGKCLHYYFYQQHEIFGFMHLRLQTWFPWIENVAQAQVLARQQLQSHWPMLLQPLLDQCHPLAAELCRPLALSYYWSVNESE